MPLYEYYCADCHETFESLRPMSQADNELPCKNCQSQRTSRTLSLFATHTKGNSVAPLSAPPRKMGGGCCGGGMMCGCH